jgi:hypothetical protein
MEFAKNLKLFSSWNIGNIYRWKETPWKQTMDLTHTDLPVTKYNIPLSLHEIISSVHIAKYTIFYVLDCVM